MRCATAVLLLVVTGVGWLTDRAACETTARSWTKVFEPSDEVYWCEAEPQPVEATTPVIVFTHSRDEYLSRTLDALLAHHPRSGFPVIISQDLQDPSKRFPKVDAVITEKINSAPEGVRVIHWRHASPAKRTPSNQGYLFNRKGYFMISRHYYWALYNIFRDPGIRRVILLEDDEEVAVDFFEYYRATAPLLDNDPTLFCVCAWNDNGKMDYVHNNTQLYRSDWLANHGLMITRRLWKELDYRWPAMYWDDWMRQPEQRRGRQCIRPEVSRVITFGEQGTSKVRHFDHHVGHTVINRDPVPFSRLDLSYLEPETFQQMFFARVAKATLLRSPTRLRQFPVDGGDALILYQNLEATARVERKTLDLYADARFGVERTGYQGFIVFTQRHPRDPSRTRWVFLTHLKHFKQLETLPGGFPKPTLP